MEFHPSVPSVREIVKIVITLKGSQVFYLEAVIGYRFTAKVDKQIDDQIIVLDIAYSKVSMSLPVRFSFLGNRKYKVIGNADCPYVGNSNLVCEITVL